MAAARWAQMIAGLLLLLPVLVPPPAASSALVFRLHGDVYPVGRFYVTMSIGVPAMPYFLDIDTGSDLTWVECDAPCQSCNQVPNQLYKPKRQNVVTAADPLCAALYEDGRAGDDDGHQRSPTQCDYQIDYADGTSTVGVLLVDQFSFPAIAAGLNLPFRCGYDQGVGEKFQQSSPVNGMLGLGRGKVSFVSQLKTLGIIAKHVAGHCLSSSGGGLFFVGDDDGNFVPSSGITWVPMFDSNAGNYYSPGLATLYFDRHSLGVKPMLVVFDSGSTYTYFSPQPYQATVSAIKGGLSKLLEQVSDPSLPLCWKGQQAFTSVFDVKKDFKSLQLSFGKNAVMEIPPENYLVVTKFGNVCLGILDGSAAKLKFNIIGDITMQDQMVIYDNERAQLGWIRRSCGRSPKSIMASFLP